MPELPEVETVRRGLHELIVNKVIAAEKHDTEKGFPNSKNDVAQFLINSKIVAVRRRAKVLIIDLSSGYSLLIHLKMTGQLIYVGETRFGAGHPSDDLVGDLPNKSTRVTIVFKDGSSLFFNDQRKFGWMRLLPTLEIYNINFMKKIGPEPLSADFTADDFTKCFTRRANTSIKAAILDQSVIAGVGNIYADESLWGAKIHPSRQVKTITEDEFNELYHDLRAVMNLSIEKGGSSSKNYVNAKGEKGSYMNFARVYRRESLPCLRCGTVIEKLRVAGRGTHICPTCQVL